MAGNLPRADLLGLTGAECSAWLRSHLGHAERIHRALYRDLMTEGRFDPGRVAVCREAATQSPGLVERAAPLAVPDPVPPVIDAITVDDPIHGTTTKVLTRTHDGHRLESVLIPMGGARHHTLCVSTQVGCRMGCTFCHTATMGLVRHLAPHEIVGQMLAVIRHTGIRPRNVVFMGMGEPLDNPEAVAQAVRVFTDPAGLAIAPRHVTVSTVGRIDGLARWDELGLSRINLAVSLTAADDAVRSALMPVNRAMPLAALREAVGRIRVARGDRILFAVVVIPGVTDQPAQLDALAAWLHGLPALVNLIPYNPIPSRDWRAPTDAEVTAMWQALVDRGIHTRLRITKGDAVMAACGQLGDGRRRHPAA
jgi:23S rRNA (adenine2503-C2)-methyltransferase